MPDSARLGHATPRPAGCPAIVAVMTTYLVTGATGNVGRNVVRQLLNIPGAQVRAVSRDPGRADLPGAQVVRADITDKADLEPVVDGIDAAFLIWPLHTGAALPGVLATLARHTRRVVLLGSGAVAELPMEQQRDLLAATIPEWTFIRPSTFAANALWWARQIRAGDTVGGAHGELAMAMLHEADIAAVAVRALTSGRHVGELALTGPAVLSQSEQVHVIGEALGRPLRWVELPRPAARRRLVADGVPESFADTLLDAYAAMAKQPRPPVTSTVEEVTGRPARTFAQWATDHAAAFAQAAPTSAATS
ncbi:NAD(P)H-binding protein [Pseudonocardia sp. TRM90224]|uniref:NAD(P)H-binding protein n=1 Tax=Pseudonocardia sp. TRM90224 TaxID=2812678 RepID=UPI001E320DFA|nr:NAD(P)H-binding protein [Pseudonocardia sp. TRM90224]